jgi:hypothetical protein
VGWIQMAWDVKRRVLMNAVMNLPSWIKGGEFFGYVKETVSMELYTYGVAVLNS